MVNSPQEKRTSMKNRTCITILTWNRLPVLKETLKLLYKHNGRYSDILFLDNGSSDGTVDWLKSKKYEVISFPKNLGVYRGTLPLWEEAYKRGYDFILNLQDDFPCRGTVPFGLIEKYLDDNPDVGYVRLNEKRDQKRNIVTGEDIAFVHRERMGKYKFKKYNYHATFNPTIMKSWLVPVIQANQRKFRERGLMEKFAKTGLLAARIYPNMFDTLPQRSRDTIDWKN